MRIACVQMRSGLDRRENIDAAAAMIREAAAQGAQFIATPEMTNIVDKRPRRLFEQIPMADDQEMPEQKEFAALAAELGIHLLIGSVAVAMSKDPGSRRLANRSLFFSPSGAVAHYDKIHLFDVDLPTGESWKESATVAGGEDAVLVKTALGTFGLAICYDVRFPHLFRQLAQNGAEILTLPAAFTVPTGKAHWATLLRARAIETGAFVVAPGQGGLHEDGRETYGHSMIVDPWGRVVAEKPDDEPGVLLADIDLGDVLTTRASLPSLTLDRAVEMRMCSL